jgi:DNA modification methylase
MENMKQYAVRHERLVWFEKPGDKRSRTFNAQEAAEHYTDEDRAVALAKGVGRVTNEALDRGRPPRTFIDIPRENSRSKERKYGKHPSMKPLALCERLLKVHSNPGEVVLVPFAGSGSECIAAANLGRNVIGFETQAEYMELMRKRSKAHEVVLDEGDQSSSSRANMHSSANPRADT